MSELEQQALLPKLSESIAKEMGLYFPKSRLLDLERIFERAAKDLNYSDVNQFVEYYLKESSTRLKTELIAKYITISETYFLREKNYFRVLKKHILPEIMEAKSNGTKRLRIWSAGCSTGEEPYSIAIVLYHLRYLLQGWEISIIGSDINKLALKHAIEGVYSSWSFRDAPKWLKKDYFKEISEGKYELIPEIRGMVDFFYLNLASDEYPSASSKINDIDIIFCRNVLMYFAPEKIMSTIDKFSRCLVPNGILLLSSCESFKELQSDFKAIYYPNSIVYKKCLKRSFEKKITISHDFAKKERVILPEQPIMRAAIPNLDEMKANCRILADEDRLDEALALSLKTIEYNKLDPDIYYLNAVILIEMGKMEEAFVALRKTIYLKNDYVLAHFMLGNLDRKVGKLENALKHFKDAITILEQLDSDEEIPNSEGMKASRLAEIILSLMNNISEREENL